jgi:hypothetical protein
MRFKRLEGRLEERMTETNAKRNKQDGTAGRRGGSAEMSAGPGGVNITNSKN